MSSRRYSKYLHRSPTFTIRWFLARSRSGLKLLTRLTRRWEEECDCPNLHADLSLELGMADLTFGVIVMLFTRCGWRRMGS